MRPGLTGGPRVRPSKLSCREFTWFCSTRTHDSCRAPALRERSASLHPEDRLGLLPSDPRPSYSTPAARRGNSLRVPSSPEYR
ncbi:unnamed protein product [Lota lota]